MKKNYLIVSIASLFLTACAGNSTHRWCPPTKVTEQELSAPVVYEEIAIVSFSEDGCTERQKPTAL